MSARSYQVVENKSSRAFCRTCKELFGKNIKILFGKYGYHISCLFKTLSPAKPKIEDFENVEFLSEELAEQLKNLIELKCPLRERICEDSFQYFIEIVENIDQMAKSLARRYLWTDGAFREDILRRLSLLLLYTERSIYGMDSEDLSKLFGQVFGCEIPALESVAEQAILDKFDDNPNYKPASKSTLSIIDVENFLNRLKIEEKYLVFQEILPACTRDDLKAIISLTKKRLGASGALKPILDAIHPYAYRLYLTQNDLSAMLEKVKRYFSNSDIEPFLPVPPMSAIGCKNLSKISNIDNGIYVETKYGGERIQIHLDTYCLNMTFGSANIGQRCEFYLRNLQKKSLPMNTPLLLSSAFPKATSMILDAEILTGEEPTIVIIDCLYYNGKSFMNESIQVRRKFLEEEITVVPNRVLLAQTTAVYNYNDMLDEIMKMVHSDWEGVVLKKFDQPYEAESKRWFQVKKDAVMQNSSIDSANLIVLGASYGQGMKANILSSFLMGCYNSETDKYQAVARVTLPLKNDFNPECLMKADGCPEWLEDMPYPIPTFIAKDPKKQPIWEITASDFIELPSLVMKSTKFRKIRLDKNYQSATTYKELETAAHAKISEGVKRKHEV
jgi:DNA ligase-3